MQVKELRRTCHSFPSQWEAKTVDGKFVYIRYRSGYLSVGVGNTLLEAVRAPRMHNYAKNGRQGPYDGDMSTAEMLESTGIELVCEGGGL